MGLAAAVKMYGHRVSEKTGMEVEIKADLHERPSARIEDNLFRIFQEALGNAAKHSGAKSVKVSLCRFKDHLVMEVQDDGLGFDFPDALSKGQGIGLKTMEERVNLMGGTFAAGSSRRKGTTIRVEVVLK
jgi:signal transduction histidine kinase